MVHAAKLVIFSLFIILALPSHSFAYEYTSKPIHQPTTTIQAQTNVVILQENLDFSLEQTYTNLQITFLLENQGLTPINEITLTLDFQGTEFQAFANGTALPLHAIQTQDASQITISLIQELQPNHQLNLFIQGKTTTLIENLGNDQYLFLFLYQASYPTIINVRVSLPMAAVLSRPSTANEIILFPAGSRNFTDGSRLFFEWKNLLVSTNQAFFIKYQLLYTTFQTTDSSSVFSLSFFFGALTGILFTILLILSTFFIAYKKNIIHLSKPLRIPAFKTIFSRPSTIPVQPIHLSIPEHKIIKALKEHNGSMLQNDLVDQVQFSKSAVSQYLSKLEKKGVIKKETLGRTNRVILLADPVGSVRET